MRPNAAILPALVAIVGALILQTYNTNSHTQSTRYTRSTSPAMNTVEDVAEELIESINYIGNRYVRNTANSPHDRRWLRTELLGLREALNESLAVIQNMSHTNPNLLQREMKIVSDYQAYQLSELEEEIILRNMIPL